MTPRFEDVFCFVTLLAEGALLLGAAALVGALVVIIVLSFGSDVCPLMDM